MEEIEQRLKEATDNCLTTHAAWNQNKKDSKTREALMEAVHELRKVAARLEIEIAISERDEMASKPIPIPAHRSNKRKYQDGNGDDNFGNSAGTDHHPQQQSMSHGGHGGGRPHGGGGGSGGGGRPPRRKLGSGNQPGE